MGDNRVVSIKKPIATRVVRIAIGGLSYKIELQHTARRMRAGSPAPRGG
jgi:hypothetical protein